MTPRTIVHLVDDTSAGGVTRMLDYMSTSPEMAAPGRHRVQVVPRGSLSPPSLDDDIIVSHLSVSWRNIPLLVGLRARYASRTMIHVEHSYTACYTGLKVRHKKRFFALLRTGYSLFDRVIAVSEAQGLWLSGRGLVRREALAVIPSCVDLAPFLALPTRYRWPRVMGAVGRFEEQKGFDTLIRAFRDVTTPDLRLRLFGEGSQRAALEALADGDKRISLHAFNPDPAYVMSQCDFIAMPSRWEAYGLVALEARASGRPILASRADGLRDHIRAGATEVPGCSVEAWRTAIEYACVSGPSFYADVARARTAAADTARDSRRLWAELLESTNAKVPETEGVAA